MGRITSYILTALLLLASCRRTVDNPVVDDRLPDIYPDYIDVTIPVGIAPMDFCMTDDDAELMDVVARGSKGGELNVQGHYADFNIREWHELTEANKGGDIIFTVSVLKDGKWTQYRDFAMHVGDAPLDDFGITYRRIAPGYEVGGNIGIYQRDIHSFDEQTILHVSAVPGQCMNCHTANRGSSKQFLIHVRGSQGGTMVQNDGTQTWFNTRTDSTKASFGYSYWHPSGNYIVSSVNSIHQSFFVGRERRIEVYDTMSDVLAMDTRNNKLLLSPLLTTDDWETYPVFSADGRTVFFCLAKSVSVPREYDKVFYSLCKIGFNPDTGEWGERIDTLLNASLLGKSFTFPRPSYDGKWLMYGVTDYGNFPINHREADLWLMNLHTGESRQLTELNSDDADSFHNWSTNSRWIVFSSRRIEGNAFSAQEDGIYTRVYFSSIDKEGRATKPFLLPQRNPKKFYHELFDSYNCPDFTHEAVEFDAREAGNAVRSGKRVVPTL